MSKVNLDSPAFGPGANLEPKENAAAPESQSESGKNEVREPLVREPKAPVEPSSGDEPVVEEQMVPYSRFKTVVEARREAERRADEAERNAEEERIAARSHREPATPSDADLPTYWVKLYGDSDVSKEAYKYELQRQDDMREAAREEAREAFRQERAQESEVLSQNERTIDNRLDDLADNLGRDISAQEEAAVLDIVDEYTPKDTEGNYAGELMSFDKAWEIHELRQSQATTKTRKARSVPAALTSDRTEGEPDVKEAQNKSWNPLDWNAYKKRVPNN